MKRLLFVLLAFLLLAAPGAIAAGDAGYPPDGFAITAASGNVANASAVATLTATTGRKVFMCGFTITSTGSTGAAVVTPTITGLVGGTHTMIYASVAGVTLANQSIFFDINPCVPASAPSTNIVLTLPALGAGNTNAAVTIYGYIQ